MRPHVTVAALILAVLATTAAASGAGQVFHEDATLRAAEAEAGDHLGMALARSGDTLVVGAHYGDLEDDAGGAYVFRHDGATWAQEATLIASDGLGGDEFAYAVAIDGDVIVVGAPYDDEPELDSGSAYVFRRDGATWVEEAQLVASDATPSAWFGFAVAVCGDVVLVGAREAHTADGYFAGAAYVFRAVDGVWVEEAKLRPDDAAAGDRFGMSTALSATRAVVGAPLDDDNGSASGSVYVFRFEGDGWTPEAKLTAPDGSADAEYGAAVAIEGATIVVGAPFHRHAGVRCGAAYVHATHGEAWTSAPTILVSNANAGDEVGRSVSIDGDTILVGAPGDDEVTLDGGAVHVLHHDGTTWSEEAKLIASVGTGADALGVSVALDGDTAIVGAPGDDVAGLDAGAAHVFTILCDSNADLDGDGVVGFGDLLIVASSWGSGVGPADLDCDGSVDFGDLLLLLTAWG